MEVYNFNYGRLCLYVIYFRIEPGNLYEEYGYDNAYNGGHYEYDARFHLRSVIFDRRDDRYLFPL